MKNNNDILGLPDTDANRYIKKGIFVIFAVFGILGVWSYYAKMATGVPLPGQVVIESSKKVIQHLEGGIVEEIYVNDGDFVKKGDKLLRVSDTRAMASLHSYEASYYQAIALADRLKAENRRNEKIVFSKDLYDLSDIKKAKVVKAQEEIFENRKRLFKKEEKIANQKIESLDEQINNLKNVIKSKENLLDSYKIEAKEQQELFDEKLIDKVKLREVKRKIESLKSEILSNKTDIARAKIQKIEVKIQLALSQEDFFRKIKVQLRDTLISIDDMKAKMTEVKDRLSRTVIKAPVSGIVLDLQVHTIGAVISPAKPIMEIVPTNSKLIIRAMLEPRYIDYVKVGLKANMTFPAFQLKGRFINNIEGEVIFVAADSTTDRNGNSFYTIKLVVDKKGVQTLKDENLAILAGMPAGVVVKIGQQTMLEYLLRPMAIMLDRAFLEE